MRLTNTITDLLVASLYQGTVYRSLDRELMEMLLHHDCDYYEIMKLLSTIMPAKCPAEDIELLQSLAPVGTPLRNLEQGSIRGMIPRWTGSKYHTAPIAQVIRDIQRKSREQCSGIFSYHSNLNPRNKNSTDDLYVLLVSKKGLTFLDINRRWSYTYLYGEGEKQQDEVGSL